MQLLYNKIIIIGDAGRGKSTLASALSKKLNIPHHSTDDYFYEVKFSKPRNREESLKQVTELYEGDFWIIEGTTQWLLAPGLDKADIVVYLKYKNIFSQWYMLLKRHFSQKGESLKEVLALMRYVFFKRYRMGPKKGKPTHEEVLASYKNKVITLSSFKDINQFLDTI